MPHAQDLGYHTIEKLELARGHVDPLWVINRVALQELVWMIRNLPQLHHSVAQALISSLTRGRVSCQPAFKDAVVNNFLPV